MTKFTKHEEKGKQSRSREALDEDEDEDEVLEEIRNEEKEEVLIVVKKVV